MTKGATTTRKQRKHPQNTIENSKAIVEKAENYIPFNYVAKTQEVLRQKGITDIAARRIQRVRLGLQGDLDIAKALYEVAIQQKMQFEKLEEFQNL